MSGKISQDTTVPYKAGIFIPGVDMTLGVGNQNVKLLASSFIGASFVTPQQFGAVGDGVTDDTTALQGAINAGIAGQIPIYIPAGRYLISAALVINRGCHIFGAFVEPEITMFSGTPNQGGNGTWLVLDGTHLVSAFFINPVGTPSASNQALGVEIDHIAIIHNQPVPGGGWTPRLYPPAIDIPAGSDVNIHDVFLMNPTVAIRAAGQSAGRLTIERVSGQPLTQGIVFDNQTDTVVVRDIHFWTYWSLDSNVLAYQKANGVGMQLGRIDNPVIDNFFCLWYWVGTQISRTANGDATAVRFTNCDWDLCGNPFVINDATGGHTVYMSGCLLGGPGDTTSTSGLTITGGGGGSQVYLSTCTFTGFGNHCVSVESGASNHVRLAACQLFQWDIRNVGGYCLQSSHTNTIRADAATLTFSLNSNTHILAGGQCIKEPAMWLTHGVMLAAGTSVVLPHLLDLTPDMMLVTPNGGPIGGATRQWWATADASNVTVHVDVAPGSDVAFSVLLGLDVYR